MWIRRQDAAGDEAAMRLGSEWRIHNCEKKRKARRRSGGRAGSKNEK